MDLHFPLLPLTVILYFTSSVTFAFAVSSWLEAVEFHSKDWKKEVAKLIVRVASEELVELAKEKLVTARDWSNIIFKAPMV